MKFYAKLYSTVQYCTVLLSTVRYSTVLYTILQYCTVLFSEYLYNWCNPTPYCAHPCDASFQVAKKGRDITMWGYRDIFDPRIVTLLASHCLQINTLQWYKFYHIHNNLPSLHISCWCWCYMCQPILQIWCHLACFDSELWIQGLVWGCNIGIVSNLTSWRVRSANICPVFHHSSSVSCLLFHVHIGRFNDLKDCQVRMMVPFLSVTMINFIGWVRSIQLSAALLLRC